MPPEGSPLTERQIDRLRRWVADGAQWQTHWAFQPVMSQTPPTVADAAWVRNPIDAFILHRLEQNGLRPAPPASKVALLRRAYYDLIGLPPKPEEVAAFLTDKSHQAFEQVVDRLLQSPQYGERWARYWLDLVRFAETNSYERDSVKPHAWRYRDYVIQSLNDDKPYDQFLREQLAGDELPAPAADAVIATGFYRLGIWDDEPADRQLAVFDALDDIVTATGQVFLGLTVNCSRCHDHKIDPITQQDYYSLLAFFHNISPMANSGPNVERKVTLADGQEATVLCVTERGPKAPETFVLARGNPALRGERVEPAFPSILDPPRPHDRRSARRGGVKRSAAGLGQLAGRAGQPLDRTRDGQPDLAAPFWTRNRPIPKQFRLGRHSADPSGTAGLAGSRIPSQRLAAEGDASAGHAVQHLPDVSPGR